MKTASRQCKDSGLKNLIELQEMTGRDAQTLIGWAKDRPKLFELLLMGAVFKKAQLNFFMNSYMPTVKLPSAGKILLDQLKVKQLNQED